jgi:hypothetical protein
MGIHVQKGKRDGIVLQYVPLLGGLYVSDEKNNSLIKQARKEAGAVQSDTFQGTKGDTVSAKAIRFLRDHDVNPVNVSGTLKAVTYFERELETKDKVKKAIVVLQDKDVEGKVESIMLALELGSNATQMLVRKVEQVNPGEPVEINLFATYKPNENKDSPYFGQSFTEHGATLKVEGKEAKIPQAVSDDLKAKMDGVRATLKNSGIIDKATVGTALRSARISYHEAIVKKIEARYKDAHVKDAAVLAVAEAPAAAPDEEEFDVQDMGVALKETGSGEVKDLRSARQSMKA